MQSPPQLLQLFPMAPANSSRQDNQLQMSQDFQQVQMSDGGIVPPKVGMVFSSPDEAFKFFEQYSCKVGFGFTKRSSHTCLGIKCHATFACTKNRPPSQEGQQQRGNTTGSRSKGSRAHGTGCRAKIVLKLKDRQLCGEFWSIEEVILDHNHNPSPGTVRSSRLRKTQKCNILYDSSHEVLLDMLDVASRHPSLEHTLSSGLITLRDKIAADAAPAIRPTYSVQPEETNAIKDSDVACSKRRPCSRCSKNRNKEQKKSASKMKHISQPEMCAEPPQPEDDDLLLILRIQPDI